MQTLGQQRLTGLDMARYVAFVGMVIVNFSIAMGAEQAAGQHSGFAAFLTASLQGRAAAAFVVLAGIGLELGGRHLLDRTITVTVKRALFLCVLGILNLMIFEADILHYYAFYFFAGVLLLPCRSRTLILVIIGLNLAFTTMVFVLDYDAGWNWQTYQYKVLWTVTGFLRNLVFNGWHPLIPWLGFLLFGIVLGRLALAERRVQLTLIIGGLLAVFGAEVTSRILQTHLTKEAPELAVVLTTNPIPPMPLYMVAGFGAASVLVGVCLFITALPRANQVLGYVMPAGRQTLTLYIAHIIIGMGVLEALGMLGGQKIEQAVTAAVLFCFLATVYSWLWVQWFKRGPIEALMRRVTG